MVFINPGLVFILPREEVVKGAVQQQAYYFEVLKADAVDLVV